MCGLGSAGCVGESEHGGCKEPDGFGMLNFFILQFSSSPPQHAFTNKRYVGSNTPIRAKDYVRGEDRTDCGWGGSASLGCCFHCSCLQTQVAKCSCQESLPYHVRYHHSVLIASNKEYTTYHELALLCKFIRHHVTIPVSLEFAHLSANSKTSP